MTAAGPVAVLVDGSDGGLTKTSVTRLIAAGLDQTSNARTWAVFAAYAQLSYGGPLQALGGF